MDKGGIKRPRDTNGSLVKGSAALWFKKENK